MLKQKWIELTGAAQGHMRVFRLSTKGLSSRNEEACAQLREYQAEALRRQEARGGMKPLVKVLHTSHSLVVVDDDYGDGEKSSRTCWRRDETFEQILLCCTFHEA